MAQLIIIFLIILFEQLSGFISNINTELLILPFIFLSVLMGYQFAFWINIYYIKKSTNQFWRPSNQKSCHLVYTYIKSRSDHKKFNPKFTNKEFENTIINLLKEHFLQCLDLECICQKFRNSFTNKTDSKAIMSIIFSKEFVDGYFLIVFQEISTKDLSFYLNYLEFLIFEMRLFFKGVELSNFRSDLEITIFKAIVENYYARINNHHTEIRYIYNIEKLKIINEFYINLSKRYYIIVDHYFKFFKLLVN